MSGLNLCATQECGSTPIQLHYWKRLTPLQQVEQAKTEVALRAKANAKRLTPEQKNAEIEKLLGLKDRV